MFVLLLCGSVFYAGAQQGHEPRIALIIANSSYETPGWALTNPAYDAVAMERALTEIGYEVHTVVDASENAMEAAFKAHGERLAAAGPEATGFFYYAGHGVQSEGLNYLIPTDLAAYEEADVWGAPRLGTLFRHLRRAGNARNFVVLDACRNNPLQSSVYSAGGNGLAGVNEEDARVRGLFIAYAAAPGQVAFEGEKGTSSHFSSALVELIKQPGLPVESLFRRVRARVEAATDNKQRPWTESGLTGEADYCFAGCLEMAHIPEVELDWLRATRVSQAGANCDLYSLHIQRYPDSPFASRAANLLRQAPCGEGVSIEEVKPCAAYSQPFTIYFEYDRSNFTTQGVSLIEERLALIDEAPETCRIVQVKIDGHTDSPGSADYNFSLSERMASTVRDYLIDRGVSIEVIDVTPFGETRPARPQADGRSEPFNRRAEIMITVAGDQ